MRHALQALSAIVWRELLKFSRQYGRLVSALVRPLLWLAVFAAGFRNVFGVAIVEPYDTYIPYDVYIAPGLIGMVLLFNGMQSSLAMVYDREMGLMRLLLTAPLPRPWILFSKLTATAVLSLAQAAAFTLLNPHVYLDTVLLVGSIGAQQPSALRSWFIAGASSASLFWFALLGFGARWLAPWFGRPRAWQVLDGLIGVTMFVLSALLVRHALSGL